MSAEGAQAPVAEPTARFLRRAALERDGFELATSRLDDIRDLLDGTAEEMPPRWVRPSESSGCSGLAPARRTWPALRSGFGSAYEITLKLTSQGFIRGFQEQLGGVEQTALVYRRASALTAANVLMGINGQTVNWPGTDPGRGERRAEDSAVLGEFLRLGRWLRVRVLPVVADPGGLLRGPAVVPGQEAPRRPPRPRWTFC